MTYVLESQLIDWNSRTTEFQKKNSRTTVVVLPRTLPAVSSCQKVHPSAKVEVERRTDEGTTDPPTKANSLSSFSINKVTRID
jgi:hypothetical protein